MTIQEQIKLHISAQPELRKIELMTLHQQILKWNPGCKLWFLNGKDNNGKVVSNPNMGYGSCILKRSSGNGREFYQVGLSANTTGISVYFMGIDDKNFLKNNFGSNIGKASVSGYCIKFKSLSDINMEVLREAIQSRKIS